jgi:hypothetical protein
MRLVRGGNGGAANPEIQAVVSMFVAAVLMTAVAVLALAIEGPRPPHLILTGTAWQWAGSEPGAGEAPIAVPDPAKYAVQFMRNGTFRAVADCNQVSGTYTTVPAGRSGGGGSNSLTLVPAPAPVAPCGAGSLSAEFLRQIEAAAGYWIAGSQLRITLAPHGDMTFSAAGPAATAAPAG